MVVRIGQQLGEYRLIDTLGKGAFAEVFLGEHRYLHTRYAIKVLHTPLIDEEERFIKEARQVAQLFHPNIVRVHNFAIDKYEQRHIPYLVMDYAPNGCILHRHPRGTQPSPQQISSYVQQIASALDYAHQEQRLVHRDVKPENILIGQGDTILLTDFGIAVVVQKEDEGNTVPALGTKAYIAPEQIEGKPLPQSDQYALGVVVYEWLCGFPPFSIRDKSTETLVSEHLYREPPSLRSTGLNISARVDQVVMRALAKSPTHRFATVTEFAQQLESALLDAPSSIILSSPTPLFPYDTTRREISPPHGQGLKTPPSAFGTGSDKLPRPNPVLPPSATNQLGLDKLEKGSSKILQNGDKRGGKWVTFLLVGLLLTAGLTFLTTFFPQYSYLWILFLLGVVPLFIVFYMLFSLFKRNPTSK